MTEGERKKKKEKGGWEWVTFLWEFAQGQRGDWKRFFFLLSYLCYFFWVFSPLGLKCAKITPDKWPWLQGSMIVPPPKWPFFWKTAFFLFLPLSVSCYHLQRKQEEFKTDRSTDQREVTLNLRIFKRPWSFPPCTLYLGGISCPEWREKKKGETPLGGENRDVNLPPFLCPGGLDKHVTDARSPPPQSWSFYLLNTKNFNPWSSFIFEQGAWTSISAEYHAVLDWRA